MMKHYALIGRTLVHSHSKILFDREHFADADYRLQEMPSVEGLREWVQREAIDGFNVTIPYKQAVLPLLDALDESAAAIGAVNCVVVERGADPRAVRLVGHNTDAPAFRQTVQALTRSCTQPLAQAFILGTGGAARAVAYALAREGVPHTFVSRTPELHPGAIGYPRLSAFGSQLSTLIVNATPLGTYPAVEEMPLDPVPLVAAFPRLVVYDLVYNPSITRFQSRAAAAGAATLGGQTMLRLQAELSWQLWSLVTGR